MSARNGRVYPDCPHVVRNVELGGLTKPQLIERLNEHSILLNTSAKILFADPRFATSDSRYALRTVELTVRDLGYPRGATSGAIYARARELGLELCPLELGPYLRLAYLDQPEGSFGRPIRQHKAPDGSITVASEPLDEDGTTPNGFYLRRIDGDLWLRGYRADRTYVWNPGDHFVFCQRGRSTV